MNPRYKIENYLEAEVLHSNVDLGSYENWPEDWTTMIELKSNNGDMRYTLELPLRLYAESGGKITFYKVGGVEFEGNKIHPREFESLSYAGRSGLTMDINARDILLVIALREASQRNQQT